MTQPKDLFSAEDCELAEGPGQAPMYLHFNDANAIHAERCPYKAHNAFLKDVFANQKEAIEGYINVKLENDRLLARYKERDKDACRAEKDWNFQQAEIKRLREALEWIAESGRILYANEIANEPYFTLVQRYREHEKVARAALEEK